MGDLLDQATEVWTKAEEKPKGTFNKLRILSDLIMNMATGRKNNGGGSTAPKAAFEDTWERFLMLAEYETNIDPYRGMMKARVDNSEREEVDFSPWQKSCEWSRNTFNKNTSIEDDDDGSKRIVENTECSCPSIIFWTRQAHSKESSKRGKKRQRNAEIESERFTLGKRSSAVCECDFNPFCLFSLGGVMDDILEEKCLKISTEPSRDSDDSSNKESPPTSDLILVDDEMHSGGEPTTTNDAQKSSHVDVDLVTEKENAVADRSPSKRENPEAVDPTNIYSKTTAEELKQLRKSVEINTDLIRSYVREVLLNIPSNPFALMEKEYTNLVCAWHKSLVFWNPLVTYPTETNESLMALSVPPGIKNLGATCYLNTQLQCLAQNLAFLEGIFSWRPSDNQNLQMNSVMTKLQVLLANMVHGAARTVSTTEFSDALGLEHDEQQDPNEFARLLFERMHESFQKSSSQGNGPCKGLDNLLPSIFQGVAAYKTTCLTCRTVSKRNENFMDLNLPLSRPSTETKKGKLSGMKEFLGKKSDLNLQECLNSYTCVELLNEENQYWCSHCDGKSDAQRMLTFQQLPPVLNVQLSRYVFDRQKCVKKKLTDPVSLPRVLSVPSDTKQQPSDTKQQPSDTKQQQNSEGQVVEERINTVVAKYILCAVMRHQGTSAYRGHYLAEAMDWHTGQWFEFNDDNVKLLPTGPSHSYFPCIDTQQMNNGGAKKAASSSISGSQDAYNMYYVEESFLATSVQQSITRLHRESETQLQPLEGKNVCGDVTSSRQMKYKLITE
jgi:ubiquitin carboxyl-terminal hydrolase 48